MKNGEEQNFVRRNVVFSCKEDNLDYTQFEFSLPWNCLGTPCINTKCFHKTQFLGSKWVSRVSPHDEEVFFPTDHVSILNRLIKTFRNTAPVEIGPMTNSRNSTISTTILSVNLVGMERERKIGIDDDYNDEQSRVNLLVQVQQDHHPHRGHLVVSLHWSRLSQAQNGFTWN